MQTTRCLISNISQKLLSDIVLEITHQDADIEVVGQVSDGDDFAASVSQQSIDVLILGLEQNCLPEFYREILNKFPDLLIIGLSEDGRLASVYINDVGTLDILKVICGFGKH